MAAAVPAPAPATVIETGNTYDRRARREIRLRHQFRLDDFLARLSEPRAAAETFPSVFTKKINDESGKEVDINMSLNAYINTNATLCVHLFSYTTRVLKFRWSVGLLGRNGTEENVTNGAGVEQISNGQYRSWISAAYQDVTFIKNDPLKYLSHDGGLTIFCSVTVHMDASCNEIPPPPPIITSFSDFHQAQSHTSDVILRCDDRKFHCHRVILGLHSKVFYDLFKGSEVKINDIVDIEDTTPEVLEFLICYLYNTTVGDCAAVAKDLVKLADKYKVDPLKTLCCETLLASLSVDNAADLLVLGGKYLDAPLETAALDLIVGRFQEVIVTEGWNRMTEENPRVMQKVLCGVMAAKK